VRSLTVSAPSTGSDRLKTVSALGVCGRTAADQVGFVQPGKVPLLLAASALSLWFGDQSNLDQAANRL
jgi:3,4-dihydroxy-2-butanone 4-phosphate synthase